MNGRKSFTRRGKLELLLELGGDLSCTNVSGNDFVAIAAASVRPSIFREVHVMHPMHAVSSYDHNGAGAAHTVVTPPDRWITWLIESSGNPQQSLGPPISSNTECNSLM